MIEPGILAKLKPWQGEPAERLLNILANFPSATDMSDTGVGKTYVAAAIIATLKLPTLVIGPKISETAWREATNLFGESISFIGYEKLRTGNYRFGTWEHQFDLDKPRQIIFVCQCCQRKFGIGDSLPCYANAFGIHCVATKKAPVRYGTFSFCSGIQLMIFDEAHRCSGLDSLNADMLTAARRQGIKTLLLSATLFNSPLKAKAIGYSLDLFQFPQFHSWAYRNGVRRHPAFKGLHWLVGADEQKRIMADIRASIIPERGVRITTSEIPDFPEVSITAELYDIEKPEQIDQAYKDMGPALEALDLAASEDKAPDHPLTKQLRARQKIELLKIPIAIELASDLLEKGFSLCIFCNFTQTIKELSTRLDAPFIDGSVKSSERNRIIESFQGQKTRCLILNSEAAGISISLQDLDGDHPRMGLVFPPQSAVTFRQLVGRFPRTGGKSKSFYRVLLAANTVERGIHRNLKNKLDCLDSLLDGDLMPDNLKL